MSATPAPVAHTPDLGVEYRKTTTIRAVQWWAIGDHPAVQVAAFADSPNGWIETLEGGHIVSPGDWIATGIKGEHWPIKPDVFEATYEPVGIAAAEGDLLGEALKALAKCAEAPFSGWTIAQAIARDVLSRAGKLKAVDHD